MNRSSTEAIGLVLATQNHLEHLPPNEESK